MKPIQTITFAVNSSKPGAAEAAEKIARIVENEGCKTNILEEYPLPVNALNKQDLCCAVGGDGTLLGVLDAALHSDSAVLGINLGKLGFLSTFNEAEAALDLPKLIKGEYSIADRSVLSCKNSNGETVHALNDVVIKETQRRGLIRLCVSVDGKQVSEYYGDGLIFSTPTGSTAYNLSAGGPIIGPTVRAIAMTPICPHTLGNRSVIFDDSTQIKIESDESNANPRIAIDGRVRFGPDNNFPIELTIAEKKLRLMQNPNHSHFAIVRDKLNWSGSMIQKNL
ncbi:MAG: NAD+ kinase [Zhongshania aliphaticivorans]|jgi:NAD+ kinase